MMYVHHPWTWLNSQAGSLAIELCLWIVHITIDIFCCHTWAPAAYSLVPRPSIPLWLKAWVRGYSLIGVESTSTSPGWISVLLYMWHQLYKTVCKTVKVPWYPPRYRLILFLCMSPLYGFFHFPFAPASFPGHVGETTWQLPQVQTAYGCKVTAIAYLLQAVKSMWYVWYFHQLRTVLSCSWKQLFAAGSATEGKLPGRLAYTAWEWGYFGPWGGPTLPSNFPTLYC